MERFSGPLRPALVACPTSSPRVEHGRSCAGRARSRTADNRYYPRVRIELGRTAAAESPRNVNDEHLPIAMRGRADTAIVRTMPVVPLTGSHRTIRTRCRCVQQGRRADFRPCPYLWGRSAEPLDLATNRRSHGDLAHRCRQQRKVALGLIGHKVGLLLVRRQGLFCYREGGAEPIRPSYSPCPRYLWNRAGAQFGRVVPKPPRSSMAFAGVACGPASAHAQNEWGAARPPGVGRA